jgi:hypothetical protein
MLLNPKCFSINEINKVRVEGVYFRDRCISLQIDIEKLLIVLTSFFVVPRLYRFIHTIGEAALFLTTENRLHWSIDHSASIQSFILLASILNCGLGAIKDEGIRRSTSIDHPDWNPNYSACFTNKQCIFYRLFSKSFQSSVHTRATAHIFTLPPGQKINFWHLGSTNIFRRQDV